MSSLPCLPSNASAPISLCVLLFSAPVNPIPSAQAPLSCHAAVGLDMNVFSAALGFDLREVLDFVDRNSGLPRARAWHCVREAVRIAMAPLPGACPAIGPELYSIPEVWRPKLSELGADRHLTILRFIEQTGADEAEARRRADARAALGWELASRHGGLRLDLPAHPFLMDSNPCEAIDRMCSAGLGMLDAARARAELSAACPQALALASSVAPRL